MSGSSEPPTPEDRVAQAEQFLNLLFEQCRGWFGVSHKTGKGYTTRWYDASHATQYPMAARSAVNLYEVDTYVRMTTVDLNLGPRRRGRAGDAVEMAALYLDVDAQTGVHKHDAAELPPDIETGLSTLLAGGLPEPSLVISSGGGCYPIWLLSTPITDVAEMKEISNAWHRAAESIFRASGFHLDKVSDLSRMLRIPGTLNAKDPTGQRLATIWKPPSRRLLSNGASRASPRWRPVRSELGSSGDRCAVRRSAGSVVVGRAVRPLDGARSKAWCPWPGVQGVAAMAQVPLWVSPSARSRLRLIAAQRCDQPSWLRSMPR